MRFWPRKMPAAMATTSASRETPHPGKFIRPQGQDFRAGAVLARQGKQLTARDLALLAAGDLAMVEVRRRPVIAFAATGDELSRPGEPRKPGGIVASSVYGLDALIAQWGGAGPRPGHPARPAGRHRGAGEGEMRSSGHLGRRLGGRSRSGAVGAGADKASRSISGRSPCGPASR